MIIAEMQAQQYAPDPERPERVTSYEGMVTILPGTGSTSCVLPDGRAVTVVVQAARGAEGLATATRDSDGEVYANVAKPVATVIADALAAAGVGGS